MNGWGKCNRKWSCVPSLYAAHTLTFGSKWRPCLLEKTEAVYSEFYMAAIITCTWPRHRGKEGSGTALQKKEEGLRVFCEAMKDCPEVGHLMWLVGHIDGFLWSILSSNTGQEYRDAGRTLTKFWQCWASCCRNVVWFPKLVASEVVSQSSVVIQGLRGSHHRRSHVQVDHCTQGARKVMCSSRASQLVHCGSKP